MTMTNLNRTSTSHCGYPELETDVEKVRAAMKNGQSERQEQFPSELSPLGKKGLLIVLCALPGFYCSFAQASSMYFVHTDHLGTPQMITDSNQQKVWEGRQLPFGETKIVTGQIEFNVRFPGQYYDQESGLHYNYFRDYDPSLGRYIQSDPIGLAAGMNTYSYSFENPITNFDFFGLDVCLDNTARVHGLHQRVAVYNSSGELEWGQSFGADDTSGGLSRSEGFESVNDSGGVYPDLEPPIEHQECFASNDDQNRDIIREMLHEIQDTGPYSATTVMGRNCRTYSKDLFDRLNQKYNPGGYYHDLFIR